MASNLNPTKTVRIRPHPRPAKNILNYCLILTGLQECLSKKEIISYFSVPGLLDKKGGGGQKGAFVFIKQQVASSFLSNEPIEIH
jgi:hypothetical protein